VRERSAERTRARQPLLPTLLTDVRDRRDHLQRLLASAADSTVGQPLQVDGRAYTRVWTGHDERRADDGGEPLLRVRHDATGQNINVTVAEDQAFWDWAMVETLRLSGIRIEEMLELSQLSVRRYQRPNGETIGLLVIAPSKSDRERVIPMSAELFAVVAAIIRRHTQRAGAIPMTSRYDTHEKIHTPAMPFLFQRRHGNTYRTLGQHTVLQSLQRRCTALAETHPEFGHARFTPHDFRRLFATDVVNNGLPIHIGAALLGHLNLETTRGYVAVFEEDLIRHYQAFLEQRRRTRPSEEYRPPTDTEWGEFEQHFDHRKVELGNCGRPYGTGCAHEHACLRCPMLHVEPAMLPRLDAIEDDLRQRRARAEAERWLGEIDGIDITLSRLAGKRDQAQRIAATGPVLIGMPTPPPATS
jgi:site-specific recombinase XerC